MGEAASDGEILVQIRELAGVLSDLRSRSVLYSVVDALELNPQPLPPGIVRIVLDAIALSPQPSPPAEAASGEPIEAVGEDSRPIPPAVLRTVLEALALNPQPLPPQGTDSH